MIELKRTDSCDPLLVTNPTMDLSRNRHKNLDQEFDFWGENGVRYDCKDDGSINFQGNFTLGQENTLDGVVFGTDSVPIGDRHVQDANASEDSSPLLPYDHHYSNLSPRSRTRVIEQGRKELMEMIKDMPDSFYELSLKDIVDEHERTQQGTQEHPVIEESSHQNEAKQKRKKPTKGIRPGQMPRTSSLESETLRLKMFFPAFLASKKQPKQGNRSKVSPRPSVELSREKYAEKETWKKNFPVPAWDQSKKMWCDTKRTRKSNSCTSRNPDDKFSLSCWPFGTASSKLRRQKTCSF